MMPEIGRKSHLRFQAAWAHSEFGTREHLSMTRMTRFRPQTPQPPATLPSQTHRKLCGSLKTLEIPERFELFRKLNQNFHIINTKHQALEMLGAPLLIMHCARNETDNIHRLPAQITAQCIFIW